MAHDFKKFPELTNHQMQLYYMDSPHKQITEGIVAWVVGVHDGDSIKLRWSERNFDFPMRFKDILAPELSQEGGIESRNWLIDQILGEEVYIQLDPKDRVDKWGRLLGKVICKGVDITDLIVQTGHAVAWEDRNLWQT